MKNQLNPFSQSTQQLSVSGAGESSKAIAEVQASMMLARQNPRDQIQAMDRILNACTRPTLAEIALYQYARGGQDISGPSIRLAEAVAQAWGNINLGVRELEQSDGSSTVQAFAWDIESNTRKEITFQVPHIRYSRSKGNTKLTDPRDIYELVANQGARRLRACILAIIPGDVVDAAVRQCELTMTASADLSQDGIKRILDAFIAIGVSQLQIEKRIQRRIDTIQPAQVVQLKKIYTSIRDGMSSASDWFEPVQENKTIDSIIGNKKNINVETGEITENQENNDNFDETESTSMIDEKFDLIKNCQSIGDLANLVKSFSTGDKEKNKEAIRLKQNELRGLVNEK